MANVMVLINNGRVHQVWEAGTDGRFHPDLAAGEFPPMPPGMNWIDVSGEDPQPEVGWTYVDGVFTAPTGPELSVVKNQAKIQVDTLAEGLRLQVLTPGEGQAQAYELKTAELAAYDAVIAASGTPVDSDYPVCAAEIGITAADLAGVMAAVRAKRAEWVSWCAAIEAPRLQAKANIDSAVDPAGVQAVLDGIVWPSV